MVRALTIKWFEGAKRIASFVVDTSLDNVTWITVLQQAESTGRYSGFELVDVDESNARYIKIVGLGNNKNDNNSIVELQVHSCVGASGEFTGVYPNELSIDLLDWYLSVPSDGDNIETYVEMIGSRDNATSNPDDGIALDEKFSYHIKVNVNLLTVTISREGKGDVVAHYDMSESLYDQDGQYHYFKVGVYHVNNSSDSDEYAQATFYQIKNSHTGYAASE